ncbi:DNA-binding domain-containing protein [Candidatus Sodalis pierantonius]|uniref:DNA-binding domain-containing protein n=1 Tax=Candidatus Sodalis pierantonii TaxID=1486991 RepID=UPI0011DC7F69
MINSPTCQRCYSPCRSAARFTYLAIPSRQSALNKLKRVLPRRTIRDRVFSCITCPMMIPLRCC